MTLCMLAQWSVRATARHLGVRPTTAFAWRHRLLAARHSLPKLTFTTPITCNLRYYLPSAKGWQRRTDPPPLRLGWLGLPPRQGHRRARDLLHRYRSTRACLVLVQDAHQRSLVEMVGMGEPMVEDLYRVLGPIVPPGLPVCSPDEPQVIAYTQAMGHPAWTPEDPARTPKDLPLPLTTPSRLIGELYARLGSWLGHFNGLSRRYLSNYLNWFTTAEATRGQSVLVAGQSLLNEALS